MRAHAHYRIAAIACVAAMLAFSGCSGGSSVTTGSIFGAKKAEQPKAPDPMAPTMQVAMTSAKASRCGFHFDPAKLRNLVITNEAARLATPDAPQKVAAIYDKTVDLVGKAAAKDGNDCSEPTLAELREDLPRHLAGNFSPRERKQKPEWSIWDIGCQTCDKPMDKDKVFNRTGPGG